MANEEKIDIDLKNLKMLKNFDAYSSTVELVDIDGKEFVLKTVDEEEAWNEKRFLQTMKDHGLPTLEMFDALGLKDNQILLEYVPGSKNIEWQDVRQVEQWGGAVRQMHNIKFESALRITSENKEQQVDWNDYLRGMVNQAVDSRLGGKTEMSDELLEQIRAFVISRLPSVSNAFSLLHGDLHDGNTLVKDGKVIIYDKSSEIFAGDPMYDTAIIMTHFPNGVYVMTGKESNARDRELLEAFMKGYGEDFIKTQKERLDFYTVIRCLDRYPNPFEIFNKEIIGNIIKRS